MAATQAQSNYITDLAVLKTKEFKEVKELLVASGIVKENAATVAEAGTIAEINNALTEKQASQFIDVLIATKPPARGRVYGTGRINKAVSILYDIEKTIDSWVF